MPRGRRPGPGTAAEKAAARREKVRLNVQAYRKRRKEEGQSTEEVASKSAESAEVDHPLTVISSIIPVRGRSKSDEGSDSDNSIEAKTEAKSTPSSLGQIEDHITLFFTPSQGKPYTAALLGGFRKRYLPEVFVLPSAENPLFTPCAPWVTSAYKFASALERGPLLDGLLALELATLGAEHDDVRLQIASRERYHHSIFNLRRHLQTIVNESSNPAEVLQTMILTCHVAAAYEVVVNHTWYDMVRHVRGIGVLIKRWIRERGFDPSIGKIFLDEYRMLEIAFCLQERRSSTVAERNFLAEMLGINPHGHTKSAEMQGPFATLLDLGDRIPPTMEYIDGLRRLDQIDRHMDHLEMLARGMASTICEVENWLNMFEAMCGKIILCTKSEEDSQPSSNRSIGFTSLEAGSVFVYAFAIKLHAYETCIQILSEMQTYAAKQLALRQSGKKFVLDPATISPLDIPELRAELLDAADLLAHGVNYFLQDDKGFTGRSLGVFPLGTSYQILIRERNRLLLEIDTMVTTDFESAYSPAVLATKVKQVNHAIAECEAMAERAKSYGMPLFGHG